MARPKAKGPLPSRKQPKRTPTIDARRAFGSKSNIGNGDIQNFLANCMSNWSNYTEEEKLGIIASVPPTRQPSKAVAQSHLTTETSDTSKDASTTGEPPIDHAWLRKDENVKRAVARFTRDVADGYYEKSWQDKARKASQDRADGKLDEYWRSTVEQMFCPMDDVDHGDGNSSDGEYRNEKTKHGQQQRPINDC